MLAEAQGEGAVFCHVAAGTNIAEHTRARVDYLRMDKSIMPLPGPGEVRKTCAQLVQEMSVNEEVTLPPVVDGPPTLES